MASKLPQITYSQTPCNLDQIESRLSALHGGPLAEKKKFVEWLASKEEFPRFIRTLLQNPQKIQEIADRSFPHKNGFDMLQLMMTEKFELRCHIWPKTFLASQENIHNHRWDLASRILVGTLKQDFFKKIGEEPVIKTFLADPAIQETVPNHSIESIEIVQRKRFTCQPRPSYFRDLDETRKTTPYKMTQIKGEMGEEEFVIRKLPTKAECSIQAGGSYSLDQSNLHRIVRQKGDPMTATLMLNTGPYAPACQVFSTRNLEESREVQVHTFSADAVREKLTHLLERYLQVEKM